MTITKKEPKKDNPKDLETVLYIEDNPSNVALMKAMFARFPKLDLKNASSAEIGLAMIAEEKPDLILMDIGLPGMSGIEACRILKKDPKTSGIPVIAISGNVMAHDIAETLGVGFELHISKPFSIQHVIDSLSLFVPTSSDAAS